MDDDITTNGQARVRPSLITLREAVPVWIRIACLSFGGPAGQIALMHRELVDERRWIGERRFLHALNFCMLLPGPEAQQLATYIGWLMHGVRGGLFAGVLFVLPGAVAIMALSWAYVLFGHLTFIAGVFFGLKAAVLAIVAQALIRVGKRALKDHASKVSALISFVAIFVFGAPFPVIVLTAGLIGLSAGRAGSQAFAGGGHGGQSGLHDRYSMLGDGPSAPAGAATRTAALVLTALWLLPIGILLALTGPASIWSEIGAFFARVAIITFGGAYAVLGYVAQAGVERYHWLTPGEMLDGLSLAESTPGPLIIVTQFVGFLAAFRASTSLPPLVAGTLGALLTTWVTFVPCFVWIFAGAPFVERLRENRALASALGAITAAVVGVIANLALWFALHFLFSRTVRSSAIPTLLLPDPATLQPWAVALSAAAAVALLALKRSVLQTLALCAVLGVAVRVFL